MISKAKLRWRCRRGMRELDALLLGWLDSQYDNADDQCRILFAELLKRQDPDIMRMINSSYTASARTGKTDASSHGHENDAGNLAGTSRFDSIILQLRAAQAS